MIWHSLFSTVKRCYLLGLCRVLIVIFGIITICGCSSYDKELVWADAYYGFNRSPVYNPGFIFDNPGRGDRVCQISSEQFGRLPWPVSSEACYYVNGAEVISYEENYYDYQYQTADGRPRNRLYSRMRGYRTGQVIR